MDRDEIDKLRREARAAFKNNESERAFALSEQLATENVPSALFRCGLILEKGWLNGTVDLDRAWSFYNKLAINWNEDLGYLGCVRLILSKGEQKERDKAIQYCEHVLNGPVKYRALLLLGRIYEELYTPPNYKLAKKAYLKAIFHGSAWALRKYAVALGRSGNLVGSLLMHVVATVASPIFVLFGGMKVTRRG